MKNRKNYALITNTIIFFVIFVVGFVCFSSEGTVAISGETYGAIYNGNRDKPNVAIMINVYENSEVVDDMVDLLKEKEATATFFVGGCWADDNRELLCKIVENGNEIGNHGYFHKQHGKLSFSQNVAEIKNNHTVVRSLCGVEMKLFAPPSGDFSTNTLKAAESLSYTTIMWSKDTIDWRDSDVELIFKRATDNLCNGDFILMHPKTWSLEALSKILDYYKKAGKKPVTVSKCME